MEIDPMDSMEMSSKLDQWNNIFGDTAIPYDEEAFERFKYRNKLSDDYEKERQELLKICGQSIWTRYVQRSVDDNSKNGSESACYVEIAMINKWNSNNMNTINPLYNRLNRMSPPRSMSPSLSSDVSSMEVDDSPYHSKSRKVSDIQIASYEQQPPVRLMKDSFYIAFMRILPNGFKEEQVCPAGVEIQFHILYGRAIFHYGDRCQQYQKGQTIRLKPRMLYKIQNPRLDQYTYLIYWLKVISSSTPKADITFSTS